MDASYSYTFRLVPCEQCAQPIQAAPGGGMVTCSRCNAPNTVSPRDERPVTAFGMGMTQPIPEPERLMRLRAQDGKPLMPPASVMALMPGGQIPDYKLNEALTIWRSTRARLRSMQDHAAGEELMFLSIVLSQQFISQQNPAQARAMLEGALDVLSLPRHRQLMLGLLSRGASRMGDVESAERWLAPCDPVSDDLEADTSYRLGRALIDTGRGNYANVVGVLGSTAAEIPIRDGFDEVAGVLRANAYERNGQVQVAAQQLVETMAKSGPQGRQALEKIIQTHAHMGLCAQSYPMAAQHYAGVAAKAASARQGGGVGALLFYLGILLIGGGVVTTIVALTQDGDFWTGIPVALPGVILFFVGGGLRRSAKRAERLRLHGISGRATIVGVRPTGTRINNVPMVEFQLRIELPGRAPYEATSRMLLSGGVGAVQPGATVAVRVDPQTPTDVLIESE